MSIAVTCPECDNGFAVGDEMAGKRGRCPECGGVFRAGESVEFGNPDEVPVGITVSESGPKNSGKRRSGKKKKRRAAAPEGGENKSGGVPVGVWAAVAFVGVLLLCGGGYMLVAGDKKTVDNQTTNKADKTNQTDSPKDDKPAGEEGEKKVASQPKPDTVAQLSQGPSKPAPLPRPDFQNDIIPAIARIVPYFEGKPIEGAAGSGFFVNDKQWIVTNHHVIEHADAVKVMVFGNEKLYDLEGIVYRRKRQDIAIVKPKEVIPAVKTLTVPDDAEVTNADRIFVIGNPFKTRFITTHGIVTRTTNRSALNMEKLKWMPKPPEDATPYTLIEYDARVFPGSDGSPVINAQGQVIALHLSVHRFEMDRGYLNDVMFQFGMGIHSKYVAKAIKAAGGRIKPFDGKGPPDEPEPEPSDVAGSNPKGDKDGDKTDDTPADTALADKIKAVTDECVKRKWTANDKDEYATLALLAHLITEAKEMQEDEDISEEARDKVNAAADASIKIISESRSLLNLKRINEQATNSRPESGKGIFVAAQVVKSQREEFRAMQVIGLKEFVIMKVSKNASEVTEGSRWIVLGQYLNRFAVIPGQNKPVPFLKVYALIELN